jgi:lipopolysaccharide transport system ATP-binding protein
MCAAITIDNLSKAYHIGLKQERHDTFVGALQGLVRAPLKNFRHLSRLNTFRHCDDSEDIFWALRDVSFGVQEGEVVGIIGRNGAGKSTLLKILSRITEPTRGRAVIRGRVSSLLEVGTGFHQELTGRENVYMNGTILGMTKREIDRKFDEIVDFSGVEKFLDTPIKHYSSGMKVRLAFAVAAHLEPEILIIDEVLAVGDAEFQKKCLGKMHDVARGGRTVIFVSHNMAAVEALCTRGVFLAGGAVRADCSTREVIDLYLDDTHRRSTRPSMLGKAPPTRARFTAVRVYCNNNETCIIPVGSPVVFRIGYEAFEQLKGCRLRLKIINRHDQVVAKFTTDVCPNFCGSFDGEGEVNCYVPAFNLMPGEYTISLVMKHGQERLHHIADAERVQIVPCAIGGSHKLPDEGVCFIPCEWRQTESAIIG